MSETGPDAPEVVETPASGETPRASIPGSDAAKNAAAGGKQMAAGISRSKWIFLGGLAAILVIIDQVTKLWAVARVRPLPGGRWVVFENFLDWHYVHNTGAAWGFLGDQPEAFRRPFFLIVSVVCIGFIMWIYARLGRGQWLLATALACVLGGAIGNFIDRALYGYVIDFIEAHWYYKAQWPTFNVADIGISIGVVALFVEMFVGENEEAPAKSRKRGAARGHSRSKRA